MAKQHIIPNDTPVEVAYDESSKAVLQALVTINNHVLETTDKQKPHRWGHVADMAYVAEQLDLLHCFLTGEGR